MRKRRSRLEPTAPPFERLHREVHIHGYRAAITAMVAAGCTHDQCKKAFNEARLCWLTNPHSMFYDQMKEAEADMMNWDATG